MDLILGSDGKDKVEISDKTLQKHLLALGGSGSGKTVLVKTLIEEAALRNIPSIVVDLQGDLSALSLAAGFHEVGEKGLTQKQVDAYAEVPVRIYTPGATLGIPLKVSPFFNPDNKEEEHALVGVIVSSLLTILGYKPGTDAERTASAVLTLCLKEAWSKRRKVESLDALLDELKLQEKRLKQKTMSSASEFNKLLKKLTTTTFGTAHMLLSHGIPLRIEEFLKHKNQVSVIYVNHLANQREKDFFITLLVAELYQWMLHHPSEELQLLFCIDEIAPYLPAGTKQTAAKDGLKILFKQARKYGVGCVVATQNPGDIDYKAFAQFSTWCLGRLTAKQDRKKIQEALESFGNEICVDKLASIPQGEFMLFSPDEFEEVIHFQTRWLLSKHKTLTEKQIKEVMEEHQPILPKEKKEKTKRELQTHAKHVQKDKILALHLDTEELEERVEDAKKRVSLLSNQWEEVESMNMLLFPLLKLQLRQTQSKLFGLSKQTKEFDVLVNLHNGELMVPHGKNMRLLKGFKLLTELEAENLDVLKHMLSGHLHERELQKKTGLSISVLKKRLLRLKRKEFVDNLKKEKDVFWKSMYEIELPRKLEHLHAEELVFGEAVYGTVQSEIIDKQSVITVLTSWYGSHVESHEVIYLPVMEVVLMGKHKRILRFNGYTKEEMG